MSDYTEEASSDLVRQAQTLLSGQRQHSHGQGGMWHRGSDPASSARS